MSETETHTEGRDQQPDETGALDTHIPTSSPTVSPLPVIPQLSVALALLVFVFGVTYIGATNSLIKKKSVISDTHEIEQRVPPVEEASPYVHAFDDVTLNAKSAIVWDVTTQRVLFNKNADEQLPLASITKLMTALVVYELIDPEARVAITLDALEAEGDSGFVDGEEFTMQNLADLTLISSSNDGASALSATAGGSIRADANPEVAFVKAMNLKAEELGLTNTRFENSTGLDLSKTRAGAYGSARDIALLMEYIITNVTDAVALTNLDVTTVNNEAGQYHIAKNTNESIHEIEGLIASKTGYTDLSGGNLVVAVNVGLNRPVIVTVLGSTQEGRFADTLDLIDRARTSIENESL